MALQGEDYAGEPEPLLLDSMIGSPWDYYVKHRPGHSALRKQINPRFDVHRNRTKHRVLSEAQDALNAGAARVWVVLDRPGESRPKVGRDVEIVADVWVADHTARILLLELR
jgi:hypothetical protein